MTHYSILGVFVTIVFIFLFQFDVCAQGSAGSAAVYESRSVVDMPTAGIIAPINYALAARMSPNGNFSAEMAVVPYKNFNIRLFATAKHLISNVPLEAELPSLQAQFRFVDETRTFPALAVGLTSKTNGYFTQDFIFNQSVGGWISVSKNFRWFLGSIALHGGIFASSHSFGNYVGFEQSIGNSIAVVAETALIRKDNSNREKINGLCNAAFRWSVVRGITLELIVHDIFSSIHTPGVSRAFGVEFIRAW
jgi:hypothetical protein